MNFSIIIPAHNEEDNIEQVINGLEHNLDIKHEVIVVDDHSTDNTVDIVRRLAVQYRNNIRLVKNNTTQGFSNALKTGISNANSNIVVPVMADLCDDPNTINRMYEKAQEGFDIVCGSRYMPGGRKIGGPKIKSFFSRFVSVSLHFLIGIPTYDISNSFKLYRRGVIQDINIKASGFDLSVEIPLKAYFLGYKITEVPTTWIDRKDGVSKFKIFKQSQGYLKLYLWAIWKSIFRA